MTRAYVPVQHVSHKALEKTPFNIEFKTDKKKEFIETHLGEVPVAK